MSNILYLNVAKLLTKMRPSQGHSWQPQKWFSRSVIVAEPQVKENHLCLGGLKTWKMCSPDSRALSKTNCRRAAYFIFIEKLLSRRQLSVQWGLSGPAPKQQTILQLKNIYRVAAFFIYSFSRGKLQFEGTSIFGFCLISNSFTDLKFSERPYILSLPEEMGGL